jgi:hypothetical protein
LWGVLNGQPFTLHLNCCPDDGLPVLALTLDTVGTGLKAFLGGLPVMGVCLLAYCTTGADVDVDGVDTPALILFGH